MYIWIYIDEDADDDVAKSIRRVGEIKWNSKNFKCNYLCLTEEIISFVLRVIILLTFLQLHPANSQPPSQFYICTFCSSSAADRIFHVSRTSKLFSSLWGWRIELRWRHQKELLWGEEALPKNSSALLYLIFSKYFSFATYSYLCWVFLNQPHSLGFCNCDHHSSYTDVYIQPDPLFCSSARLQCFWRIPTLKTRIEMSCCWSMVCGIRFASTAEWVDEEEEEDGDDLKSEYLREQFKENIITRKWIKSELYERILKRYASKKLYYLRNCYFWEDRKMKKDKNLMQCNNNTHLTTISWLKFWIKCCKYEIKKLSQKLVLTTY